jgi:hypothetical protein
MSSIAAVGSFDLPLIAVPTPLRESVPDLTYVIEASTELGKLLREGGCFVRPPFGRLLGSRLLDASESAGDELSFSWPVRRLLPFSVMRLDHALGSDGLAPVVVRNLSNPGSDHRALEATWAVRQMSGA